MGEQARQIASPQMTAFVDYSYLSVFKAKKLLLLSNQHSIALKVIRNLKRGREYGPRTFDTFRRATRELRGWLFIGNRRALPGSKILSHRTNEYFACARSQSYPKPRPASKSQHNTCLK
ncbi:predicted protein [Coccidioides posadasii str. Silveira]|uniref:Predicted protein n=2 Tax=Coccidioides posadasii TaxID=199306 RepID=E9CRN0_COCPS|nr:predicted protein [Coccidioides posadasii str. Silveira]KMM63999.1 hypothetical protein CPAG_00351 [Coccidioides posadasii RMSCC 3488]